MEEDRKDMGIDQAEEDIRKERAEEEGTGKAFGMVDKEDGLHCEET